MLVHHLQHHLEQRYDLQQPYQITAFVSHDPEPLAESANCVALRQEAVLVRQSHDDLELTLYLDSDTLDRASSALRVKRWQAAELDSVCAVVEGVSHALCLLWHAHHEREVRAIDLELQAEVDKYLLLSTLVADESARGELIARLFKSVRYVDEDGALQQRYRQANDHAARYCRHLHGRYPGNGLLDAVNDRQALAFSRELCRFYRLPGWMKWRHIQKCH